MSYLRNERLHAISLALLLAAGCGSSPIGPSLPILQGPGPYWLELIGFAISSDPEVPPCQPPVTVLTAVRLRVDMTQEGALWVGRSPAGIGDLELKIKGDQEVVGGFEVSGSVKGTELDTETRPVSDISIRFGGATGASVKGEAERSGRFIRGTMSGDIQYSNAAGSTTRCTAIIWSLQPAPSP